MKHILKNMIPSSFVEYIRGLESSISRNAVRAFQKNKKLSDAYYLFSSGFSREHQAVLKGRMAYFESLKDIGESCAFLRRNTHRLEKGLIMRPRKKIFAERFIEETVAAYKDAALSTRINEQELKWCTDVLDEYFRVVDPSEVVSRAKSTYVSYRVECGPLDFNKGTENSAEHYKPYPYSSLQKSSVTFGELTKLFLQRRSVRWYEDREVPLDLVQQAANIASFAPSACNRQPYRFVFCNNKEKTVAIAKCAGGANGFAENLPSIIAVVGDLSAYPFDRDRHVIYIDGSLAAMQLMLALESLGLSSCSINWPEVESSERKIRKVIKLKDYERVVMLLAVGYADPTGGIPFSQKKINSLILEDISS